MYATTATAVAMKSLKCQLPSQSKSTFPPFNCSVEATQMSRLENVYAVGHQDAYTQTLDLLPQTSLFTNKPLSAYGQFSVITLFYST
ncbi:hypothetical protein [Vibrio europaeus]|uniref:Uncharacterized protein n=1 Tax=Vibrio europaeus TaxID=300876 RepID=A0ABT5H206_9VIBR|nr:hypothetical protein [Vibrio europaeus]MDC5716305.1 hypothetical protein [Vibrio europaeus]MDC5725876.1 hypothetical protein [Vibrio europaeus]MDC5732865.1 hypothetical protein [Vibrio europaeus]MDC5737710.1 hypothetical protein [Vibrio europaeus]MDC5743396.1 hypothetical protein [Vibrio europaeus]